MRGRGILTDAGFWLAVFDPGDPYHQTAGPFLETLTKQDVLLPWPILYEVLCTRFVRRSKWVSQFARVLRTAQIHRIDDGRYRNACVDQAVDSAARGRPISLVDMILRSVLSDNALKIGTLVTFNPNDFRDVCAKRRIAVWPSQRIDFQ